jgi:hypothetical protein
MSLRWEFTHGVPRDAYPPRQSDDAGTQEMNPVTYALIIATMAVGLPGITRKNHREFYARLAVVERVGSPFVSGPDGPRPLTLTDVEAHLGLVTNVPAQTRGQWLTGWVEGAMDRILRQEEDRLAGTDPSTQCTYRAARPSGEGTGTAQCPPEVCARQPEPTKESR